jgi:hypothetical protein
VARNSSRQKKATFRFDKGQTSGLPENDYFAPQ